MRKVKISIWIIAFCFLALALVLYSFQGFLMDRFFMGSSFTYADYRLSIAVENGNATQAEIALKDGAKPNLRGPENQTPLMTACEKTDNVKLIEVLLAYGADPLLRDVDGETALTHSISNNRTQVAAVLREWLQKKQK